MEADQHFNFTSSEGNGMDDCCNGAGVKTQEQEVDKEDVNTVNCADDPCVVKMETEVTEEKETLVKTEKEEEEEVSEEMSDEENDDERDAEGEEDEHATNEPQDLSLLDYSHYEAAADNAYVSGAVGPRTQTSGKLSCDICGLSCISINVLLVHKRSHTGERPFHCSQCGASFTQKGNLLRHIKLHSGEKPFKCPMCSYACRRRDALSGHLRTHSVEKPFKCNQCSRSYKQRSSLEEHRERCHLYIQSTCRSEREDSHVESRTQMSTERALLLDRLASNVAKRKSTMPQKFIGDSGVCLDLSFNRDPSQQNDLKGPSPSSPGLDHQHRSVASDGGDAPSSHRPYPVPLHRNSVGPMSLTNGTKMGLALQSVPHTTQQPHLGVDSLHSDGSHPVVYTLGHLLGSLNHKNGNAHAQPFPLSPIEALRMAQVDGERTGSVYPCGHCKVIFLDYVMFTIHMGCHGFRDPLECNVCGHRSQDRYEFSSHIARGEHRV
ncbi:zinc finger protein Eos-like [Gouania willdenowi]|uniref:Zinc finger protein Eos-like n=1 Tax=Gouania willdenowi TaxID=441366 RepID=A0A8C5D4Q4_GOUWI|nr:zinc finger protein Eos-like [Gouania willdenowi]